MTKTLPLAKRLLLIQMDHAFEGRAWHGTTLTGSLRGLTVEMALWRPAPGRNHVWGYLLHAAYWKYIVRRHVGGDSTISFQRKPSDWPAPPEAVTAADLKRDIAFLKDEHRLLRSAVEAFPISRLDDLVTERSGSFTSLIQGAAAHDVYHTGQIQLVKRLYKDLQ